MTESLNISVWSDIACPWCFVGKARLDSALEEFKSAPDAPTVSVNWRAFELDPRPREASTVAYAKRLASKYNRSLAEAQQMLDTMTAAIQSEGGEANFDTVIAANTFNAHRLIQWAGTDDVQRSQPDAQHLLTDALMRGYLGHGLNLSVDAEMLAIVTAVGLDEARARLILEGEEFGGKVRADEQEAHSHGISGVPFFVIGQYGVSGAQESETLLQVMKDASA
ncbi:MAG: DsbA family oxidoreductase [Pseudomonadota bacterium]